MNIRELRFAITAMTADVAAQRSAAERAANAQALIAELNDHINALRDTRNLAICDLAEQGWTQQMIAESVSTTQQAVAKVLGK